MVTTGNLEEAASIGKFPFFDVFNPGPVDTERDLILRFTGYTTSMATNTSTIVNHKAIIHSTLPWAK
jgi:hypothetical protein